ncbi:MAG: cation transporter [Nitrospirae bacterium]|nr:cation transporter [Nitrospirota bacterium]MBF0534373.1 cation transporter [Nitrospirota bacterium]MBF0615646.1 cation transporter [Nitrospirota bacterium]
MKYPECEYCGKWSPRLSVVGNFTMSIFKFMVGLTTNSQGLMADGVHSIADTISSVFVLIALKIAGKPKDEGHPFGHGKVEYLSTMSASVFIFICAVLILIDALHSFKTGTRPIPENAAIAATLLSLLYGWLMYTSNTCAATQLNSPALLADAAESKADSLTSVAVLAGLIGSKLGYVYADTIAALVVAVFVFHISVEMFMKGVNGLIDVAVDKDILQDISNTCMSIKGIEGVKGIRSRCMGQKCSVELEIEVLSSKTVLETQELVGYVRNMVLHKVEGIDEVFVKTVPITRWWKLT